MKDMIPMEALVRAPENIPLRTIALTAYEAMRAYAKDCGDNHHRRWGGLTREHQDSLIDGVLFHALNQRNGTMVDAEAAHLHRCKQLMQAGWQWGPTFAEEDRQDPILVSWESLTPLQRHKYRIFCFVAVNMSMYLDETEVPSAFIVETGPLAEIVAAPVTVAFTDAPEGDGIEDTPGDPHGRQIGVGGAVPQGEQQASSTDSSSSDSEKSETVSPTTSSDTESQSTETESASIPQPSSSDSTSGESQPEPSSQITETAQADTSATTTSETSSVGLPADVEPTAEEAAA